MHRPAEGRHRRRLLGPACVDERKLRVRAYEKGLAARRPLGEGRVLVLELFHLARRRHADVALRRAIERVARDREPLRVGAEVGIVAGIARDEVRVDMRDRLRDPIAPHADLVGIPVVELVAVPADFRGRSLDRPRNGSAEIDVEQAVVAPVGEIRAGPRPLRAAALSDLLHPPGL